MATRPGALDQHAFGALAESCRHELHVHCYRMMGSVHDADDMVQETLLRAWRRRATLRGNASFRAWLYRIATNVCIDELRKRPRRMLPITRQPAASPTDPIPADVREPIWLEPYPDVLLAPDQTDPETYVVTRETISLAFITMLHLLPPRQRAVLIMRDVLDWRAVEVAEALGTSTSAVKSALHRARSTLAKHGHTLDGSERLALQPDDRTRAELDEYVRAWESADVPALLRLLTDDATFSMPPIPLWYRGRNDIGVLVSRTVFAGDATQRWRLLPARANRQPAFGLYRQSGNPNVYSEYGIQVLTVKSGLVSDIITFRHPGLLSRFR